MDILVLSVDSTELSEDDLIAIASFIPALVRRKYSIQVDQILRLDREFITDFYPISKGVNIKINNKLTEYIDLSEYLDYTFVSDDPLIPYLVNNSTDNYDLVNLNGFYCISNQTHGFEEIVRQRNQLRLDLYNLRASGYFTMDPGDEKTKAAYLELATLWNGTILRVAPFIVIKTDLDFIMTTEDWYSENAKRILSGELPKYHLPFQFTIRDPGDVLRAKYLMLKSYLKLAQSHPILSDQIDQVKLILGDIIEAPFGTYQQVKEYQRLLKDWKEQSIDSLTVTAVNSVEMGLQLKERIKKDLGAALLIENEGGYYVVSETDIDSRDLDNIVFNNLSESPNSHLSESPGKSEVIPIQNQSSKSLTQLNQLELPSLQLNIRPVEISINQYQFNGNPLISVDIQIEQDEFLVSYQNIDYLNTSEILSYYKELELINIKTDDFERISQRFNLYEGSELSDDQIKLMWSQGQFMNKWQMQVYVLGEQFSRIPYLYYTS